MAEKETYDNEMRGVLFLIPEDDRSERGPTYTGHLQIDGIQYRIAAWRNTSVKGTKYLSLRIQLPKDDDDEDEPRRKKKPSAKAKQGSQKPIEEGQDDYEARPKAKDWGDEIPF